MCCLNECLTSEIKNQQSSFFIRISEMVSENQLFFLVAAKAAVAVQGRGLLLLCFIKCVGADIQSCF
jgi:hypothetical protein